MNLNCRNNCRIKGCEDNVRKLYIEITKYGYDMNSHITLNNPEDIIEKGSMWGTGTKIELECSVFNNENPVEISASFLTDGPIEQFWRHMSAKYQVDIDYSFYNSDIEYVGDYEYSNGILNKCYYEENPKSDKYKELVLKNGFTLPEETKSVIISFEDLIKRGN